MSWPKGNAKAIHETLMSHPPVSTEELQNKRIEASEKPRMRLRPEVVESAVDASEVDGNTIDELHADPEHPNAMKAVHNPETGASAVLISEEQYLRFVNHWTQSGMLTSLYQRPDGSRMLPEHELTKLGVEQVDPDQPWSEAQGWGTP
jgi:hypothetical protein